MISMQKVTTAGLFELANALSVAVQMGFMGRDQASFVFKKTLRESGWLPVRDQQAQPKVEEK